MGCPVAISLCKISSGERPSMCMTKALRELPWALTNILLSSKSNGKILFS